MFSCLRWKHYFVAHISLIALLAECLTIALSGIPFSSAHSYKAYTVSTYLCIAIIAMMLLTIPLIALRGRDLLMPRSPDTIAAVLLYICGSPMLASFRGLSLLDAKTRNQRIVDMGRIYRYGLVVGVDGQVRMGVDHALDGRDND
jgi:uncharacterized membrane protein